MLLQFLCLSAVDQTDDIIHIFLPASQLAIIWCWGDDLLLQSSMYMFTTMGIHGYSKLLLVNFPSKSEVCCPQYKCQQFHDIVYTQVGSLLQCLVFLQSCSDDLTPLIRVFMSNDTTSYDTNKSPSSTVICIISFTNSCEFPAQCSVCPTSI